MGIKLGDYFKDTSNVFTEEEATMIYKLAGYIEVEKEGLNMTETVLFKVGEAEIKIKGGVPQLSTMSQEGKDVMTINNAITALNKSFGFDVTKKFPNIKETAKFVR